MEKAGFTGVATTIALRTLSIRLMVSVLRQKDFNGDDYIGYYILDKGWEWVLSNKEKFTLRVATSGKNKSKPNYDLDEDLPF